MAYPRETYRGFELEASGDGKCNILLDGKHVVQVASFAYARGVIDLRLEPS